jgi:hypothetical protein
VMSGGKQDPKQPRVEKIIRTNTKITISPLSGTFVFHNQVLPYVVELIFAICMI